MSNCNIVNSSTLLSLKNSLYIQNMYIKIMYIMNSNKDNKNKTLNKPIISESNIV
jgi:hypothetical protein